MHSEKSYVATFLESAAHSHERDRMPFDNIQYLYLQSQNNGASH